MSYRLDDWGFRITEMNGRGGNGTEEETEFETKVLSQTLLTIRTHLIIDGVELIRSRTY